LQESLSTIAFQYDVTLMILDERLFFRLKKELHKISLDNFLLTPYFRGDTETFNFNLQYLKGIVHDLEKADIVKKLLAVVFYFNESDFQHLILSTGINFN